MFSLPLIAVAAASGGCASSQTTFFRTQATEVMAPTGKASVKVSNAFGLGDADRSAIAQREP